MEDIKRVKDQITEEYPGDDVSPGIRFRGSALVPGAKNPEGHDAKAPAKERPAALSNPMKQIAETAYLSYDDSDAKGSAGNPQYKQRNPNLILQPGKPSNDFHQVHGPAVVHDYTHNSTGKNPGVRPPMIAQLKSEEAGMTQFPQLGQGRMRNQSMIDRASESISNQHVSIDSPTLIRRSRQGRMQHPPMPAT